MIFNEYNMTLTALTIATGLGNIRGLLPRVTICLDD
ncbi:hypothetical protein VP141O351_P0050 [Vibrio phage 141O35-1]|nr:hypothetical protein VP141O351_P0050 [Vibrio phage 141O35-1]CAH9015527.1 hypothetical protein VP141E351_P0049 [Vibrio phage 141E35-1]